jgi:S1-C subfamily serine protease
MTEHANPLENLSAALAQRSAAAKVSVVAVGLRDEEYVTGTLWQPGFIIASNQSLPKRDSFDVVLPGGSVQQATLAGRDPGTNIALLRLNEQNPTTLLKPADATTGAIVLAAGSDGKGSGTARLGIVNQVGPEWHSRFGGRIDRRIVLDLSLGRREEGGPVFDAAGGFLGMSTFGPRGRVLVIPAVTVERAVEVIKRDGHVSRGWLGVTLQPVAIPESLQEPGGKSNGLMAMSTTAGGPAAKAGVVAGDIIIALNDTPAHRYRNILSQLGPESIGKKATLRVIRGGKVICLNAIIEARPAA